MQAQISSVHEELDSSDKPSQCRDHRQLGIENKDINKLVRLSYDMLHWTKGGGDSRRELPCYRLSVFLSFLVDDLKIDGMKLLPGEGVLK